MPFLEVLLQTYAYHLRKLNEKTNEKSDPQVKTDNLLTKINKNRNVFTHN